MHVVFFGSGAMACLFAARFVLSGVAKVSLLDSWVEGVQGIRDNGIRLEDAHGTRVAPVRAELLSVPLPAADLAIVLVKSWQTPAIAACLSRYVRPGGLVLSLQNGLGNIEILGHGACAGVTSEGATLLGPGMVAHRGAGITQVAAPRQVVELLRAAGFAADSCAPPKAQSLIWGKLTVNCGINALTALCAMRNGELLRHRATAVLLAKAARECAQVASARGIELPFTDPVAHTRTVAEQTADNLSSMLQDIRRGAPTECDAINGAVAREGKRLGIPTPVNEALWRAVRQLTRNRERSGALLQDSDCEIINSNNPGEIWYEGD